MAPFNPVHSGNATGLHGAAVAWITIGVVRMETPVKTESRSYSHDFRQEMEQDAGRKGVARELECHFQHLMTPLQWLDDL